MAHEGNDVFAEAMNNDKESFITESSGVALIFLIVGIVLLRSGSKSVSSYRDTRKLQNICTQQVEGDIYKVETIIETYHNDNRHRNRTATAETNEVFFTYEVNGQELNGSFMTKKDYDTIHSVNIFCNPDDPDQWYSPDDIFRQDSKTGYTIKFAAGGVLILLSILLPMNDRRKRRRRNRFPTAFNTL